jgi:histidinol dehydrogenase
MQKKGISTMRFIRIDDDAGWREIRAWALSIGRQDTSASLREKRDAARKIADAVRDKGDQAVREFTRRFDGVDLKPEEFELTPDEIAAAEKNVDPGLAAALQRACDNIRRFHEKHLRQSWQEEYDDGAILGQKITPIDSAGVYVPGGKAFYPSSVLMNIVPARVAGVPEIIMVSPPSFEGGVHPAVLAAARIAGATRVFRIGGAQAVAALAYGTETIPAVSKITGPGNTYVTCAKALVRGAVEIDSEAGPSEVVVIADESAAPDHAAAEMLAQAEHDEEAMSILITDSDTLAAAVEETLRKMVPEMPRKAIIEKALADNAAIIRVRSMDEAIALSNIIAPEHLSIQTADPKRVADRIINAGAIMIGAMTPVSAGDYYAGPNHILPTGRKARFASPLSAEDFRKVSSILYYTKERLEKDAPDIIRLAETEGLGAHALAVRTRLEK